jgi:DNA-binding MarR family transcriptional regulator
MNYQDNIFFHIGRVNRVLTRKINEVVKPASLEGSGFLLLCSIAEAPIYGIRERGQSFGMKRSTASVVLKVLFKQGYVKKAQSLDSRYTVISITPAGQKIVDKYLPLVNTLNKETISNGLSVIYEKLKGFEAWKD